MNNKITCRFCVMDSSAYGIKFDDNGQCNYCKNFIKKLKDTKPLDLKELISSIKKNKIMFNTLRKSFLLTNI